MNPACPNCGLPLPRVHASTSWWHAQRIRAELRRHIDTEHRRHCMKGSVRP